MQRAGLAESTVRKAFAVLLVLLLPLGGCARALEPLGPEGNLAPWGPGPAGENAPESEDGSVLVRIVVCWSALPLAEELVAAFEQSGTAASSGANLSFDIIPADSTAALSFLASGQAELAIIGRQPSDRELAAQGGRDETVKQDARLIALDAIVVIVGRDWPLSQLSVAQLRRLFAGEYLDWQDLGLPQGQLEIVVLTPASDTQSVFQRTILEEQPVPSTAIVMAHDRAVLEYVAQHPGAIGYISTSYADDRVKWVQIDGVAPDGASIASGRYPLVHPLFMLAAARAPAEARRLLDFAASPAGMKAIKQRYALPP